MKARSEKEGDAEFFEKELLGARQDTRSLFDREQETARRIGNARFETDTAVVHANGRKHLKTLSFSGYEENPFFHNLGKGRFVEIGGALGVNLTYDGRGLASADLDGDGDSDLVLRNVFKPVLVLLRNNLGGRSLKIHLKGVQSNRFGVGAKVTVRGQMQELTCGGSFLSCQPPELHFGLGSTESCAVTIQWPSGTVTKLEEIRAGVITVKEDGTYTHSEHGAAVSGPVENAAHPLRRGESPDFELESLDGNRYAKWKGHWTVVNVWSSYCRSCASEHQSHSEWLEAARSRKVEFVSVNVDEDEKAVREMLREIPWGTAVWKGARFRDRFLNPEEPLVPTTILLDKEGRVVARHAGAMSAKEFGSFLDRHRK